MRLPSARPRHFLRTMRRDRVMSASISNFCALFENTSLPPGASNAMVVFHHPNGRTARLDRYAWTQLNRPESRDVTFRVDPDTVLASLSDRELTRLRESLYALARIALATKDAGDAAGGKVRAPLRMRPEPKRGRS